HTKTKTSPSERWEAGGFVPRMLDSLEKLDLLLLRVTLRLVTRVLRSSLGEPDHRDQSRPEWKA
ncbi:MAG: hypothetical protein QOH31_4869, partial [Verrucomicrobiota bacterium]